MDNEEGKGRSVVKDNNGQALAHVVLRSQASSNTLPMAMVLVSSLRGLADTDTCNPDTTASPASPSPASQSSDCAAAATAGTACTASVHCTAPATTSTRSGSKLHAGTMCSGVFLVEDIES